MRAINANKPCLQSELRCRGFKARGHSKSLSAQASAVPSSSSASARVCLRSIAFRSPRRSARANPSRCARKLLGKHIAAAPDAVVPEEESEAEESDLPKLLRLAERSPLEAALRVAAPAAGAMLLRTAYNMADAFWIGRMGRPELEAVGGATFATWAFLCLFDIPAIGVQSFVARAEGAGDRSKACATLLQGCYAAAAMAAIAVVCSPLAPHYFIKILGLAAGAPATVAGSEFLGWTLLLSPALAASAVAGAAFRGIGAVRPVLTVTALTVALNAALDPLLIWGFAPLGIPALGVKGAAFATAACATVEALLLFALLRINYKITPLAAPPVLREMCLLAAVGAPPAAAGIFFSLVFMPMGRILAGLGDANLAALGVAHRIEGLVYSLTEGLGVGAAALVGQWLGAGQPHRAYESAMCIARYGALVMLPFSALCIVFANPAAALLSGGDQVVSQGAASYLRLNAACFSFMALEAVADGSFTGCAATLRPLIVSILCATLRLLGVVLLTQIWPSSTAVWLVIALSCTVRGTWKAAWFKHAWRGGELARAL
ncbi:hypothetical protein CYMTET_50833 [Cymbomonas tetramitiformis]|uniref:Protein DETOXIFICATION n=1 Tax=Cymbomonas tetramitiformis TaxID=36881 RepID=A0AAE0BM99_9CHLO|nr:hypothetical protein CYMTET_50833 [Cymbomonas tetramitiformis]